MSHPSYSHQSNYSRRSTSQFSDSPHPSSGPGYSPSNYGASDANDRYGPRSTFRTRALLIACSRSGYDPSPYHNDQHRLPPPRLQHDERYLDLMLKVRSLRAELAQYRQGPVGEQHHSSSDQARDSAYPDVKPHLPVLSHPTPAPIRTA
ncbi:hypothetical protein P7C70_g7239, partial [Phenoliferia sp. Uapishka_3]